METLFDMDLDVLDLPVRIFNCLMRSGVRNIKDLVIYYLKNNGDFSKIKNLSISNQKELKLKLANILEEHGYDINTIDEDFEKKLVLKDKRAKFLSVPLYKLNIISMRYFSSSKVKTLGDLLYALSYEEDINKIDNLDELKNMIEGLRLPNIYFGMSKDEIDNIYVSDDILELLDTLIITKREEKNMECDLEAKKIASEMRVNFINKASSLVDRVLESESSLKEKKEALDAIKALLSAQDELDKQHKELSNEYERIIKNNQKRFS